MGAHWRGYRIILPLMGVEAAREEADRYYRRALAQLDALPLDAAPVRELFDQLMKRKN